MNRPLSLDESERLLVAKAVLYPLYSDEIDLVLRGLRCCERLLRSCPVLTVENRSRVLAARIVGLHRLPSLLARAAEGVATAAEQGGRA